MKLPLDLELAIRQLREAKELQMSGHITFHLNRGEIKTGEASLILFKDGEQMVMLVPSHGYDKGDG
jgi:hypothetical protein